MLIEHQQVSIRAPTRGATYPVGKSPWPAHPFQSARPRGARPMPMPRRAALANVSIRAPTRGATSVKVDNALAYRRVSIRAPTRGATSVSSSVSDGDGVSIRAPTRGATSRAEYIAEQCRQFQSARPRGARLVRFQFDTPDNGFQSARPRGARHGAERRFIHGVDVSIRAPTRGATLRSPRLIQPNTGFNPRAHAGRDVATIHFACI